mmetsp:Transcript_98732/g.190664  ORF Transcript_98732/g.190664 Transcript_98732/m.190664 type:complete len:110 (-) Transcript_98732:232-561(-)|eukprot:CAMPEP_0172699688 /NCGR_PEP_ID=MMETSP1074-20121228/30373_1 /TAXON_ID=2916 /ORGANISM="Ceratium fusus, Strain PA161109" /LENGTH=109 /DNA_ID=CAMNT_0013520943 /DNA_START=63 /DNA_END=392 /DNA_ORIENTATION=+
MAAHKEPGRLDNPAFKEILREGDMPTRVDAVSEVLARRHGSHTDVKAFARQQVLDSYPKRTQIPSALSQRPGGDEESASFAGTGPFGGAEFPWRWQFNELSMVVLTEAA